MNNEVFTDKRLLGALDYIDERFIAEVTESYTFEAPGEYKRDKKTVFKAYRRLAALAACLLLLSAAFPVLNYAVQRFGTGIWEGNAGAGTEGLEVPTQPETQALETENEITEAEVIDSGFDKYLEAFANMSADEIYAEVMKGGWIVKGPSYLGDLEAGKDLLDSFFIKTQNGEPSSVLYARYFYNSNDNGESSIYLYEIIYDGEFYNHKAFSCQDDTIFHQHKYKFLKKGKVEFTENGQSYFSEAYFLTNTDWITWEFLRPFRTSSSYSPEVGFANDYNYLTFELIYKN
jgi:hypothetical protein